jgi:glycerol uptake facilitator-like aquaporin
MSAKSTALLSNNMDNTVERLTFARLLRNSALELLLTLFMLFGVTSIIRWVIGPAPISRMIPQIRAELLIVGASVGILITGLILSPLGRITGGHMNPGASVLPYIVAQLLGSVLGVLAACAVWGPVVAEPPVAYAVLQPGSAWSTVSLFVAEMLSMAVIVLLVGFSLAEPRLAPFVPWIVGGAIGMAIVTLGTSTGGSVNPARQFGPALLSGQTRFLWVYLLAPMAGAMLATWLRQTLQRHRFVLTHRLCGTRRDGSSLSA